MLHLYYVENILEQYGIFYGYKIGPRMVGIQVGYNKTIMGSELDATINLILDNWYGGSDIKVMLVGWLWI